MVAIGVKHRPNRTSLSLHSQRLTTDLGQQAAAYIQGMFAHHERITPTRPPPSGGRDRQGPGLRRSLALPWRAGILPRALFEGPHSPEPPTHSTRQSQLQHPNGRGRDPGKIFSYCLEKPASIRAFATRFGRPGKCIFHGREINRAWYIAHEEYYRR